MKDIIKDRIEKIENNIVPQGYKKTEIGIIPEDWKVEKLGEVSDVIMGQSPSSENYNNSCIGLPLIQGNADMKNGYTSPKLYTSEITKVCNVGDIIMSVRAPVGELAISIHEACIGRGVCSIKSENKLIFYQLLKAKKSLKKYSQGSTFEAINSKDLKKINLPIPPLKEQEKIASILSTWDQYIENIDSIIESKKKQKKGLMQNLLTGEVRLPGFKGEWKEVIIRNLISESKEIEKNPSLDKLITVRLNLEGVEARKTRENEIIGRTTLYKRKEGQFIYGKQNFHKGAFGIVPSELNGFASSSDIPSFEFNNKKIIPKYFYYYWSRKNYYVQLENLTSGTGSKRLNTNDFKKIKINLPPIDEQVAIASVLSSADREIELLEDLRNKRMEEKKGLMQLLLTGIVRVGG